MQAQDVRAGLAEVNGFDVVGISVVTDHTKATDDINALWETFFKDSVGQQILHKTDDAIYAVYSDYEGDHEAPYRLTIGYRVDKVEVPVDMKHVHVQAQNYAVMSAAGEQPKALLETWEAIWSSDLERSYATDFELFGPRFFEMGVNEVLVHIGINT